MSPTTTESAMKTAQQPQNTSISPEFQRYLHFFLSSSCQFSWIDSQPIYISQQNSMIEKWLLLPQLLIYLLGRLLDDLSWHDVGVKNEVEIFEGVGVACMLTCVILQILRKRHIDGWWRILFLRSQAKFVISWALIITIGILFFNIFGCHSTVPQGQEAYLYIIYTVCCVNVAQLALTNLNYSLICNTKAHIIQLIVYEAVLFGEVIYNGHLLMLMIGKLQEKQKDYAILLISIQIANQILIMDLMFRAAYEDREREEEKEEKMLGHVVHHTHANTFLSGHEKQDGSIVPSMQEISTSANIVLPGKTKK